MRIIFSEIIKLFSKKLFLVCLVLFFVANGFVLYYTQQNNYNTSYLIENKAEYESMIARLENASKNQADNYLTEKLKKLQNQLHKVEDKDSVFSEIMLLQNLKNQLVYINGYDSFIGEMQSRADRQKSFSIFAEKGSFSYNNLERTPKDFEHLKGIELKIGNNSAVESSTTFLLTDLLVFALVFMMCILLFNLERDKGLYGLVRSTKNGRLNVIASKLIVLFGLTVLIGCVYYTSDFVISGAVYGFGDLDRNIQSISSFENCSLKLTIWQYLLLWLGGKLLTMLTLSALLSVIFVLIRNTGMIFIISAMGFVGEYVLNVTIDSAAVFNHLKYINLFYLLTGNNLFGNYLNLNFFSQPVNIHKIFVVSAVVLIVTSFLICSTAFVKQNQNSKNSRVLSAICKLVNRFSPARGSVRVLSGECYKHYRTSLVALVLLALAFFGYNNVTKDIDIVYQSAEDSAYSEYMQTLSGEMNDEKEKYIKDQEKYFAELHGQLDSIVLDNSLSADVKNAKSEHIRNILETKGKAFENVIEQRDYIKAVGKEYGIKPVYINNLFYKRLLENSQREWEYFALLLGIVIFSTSNLFACEHKNGMANLICCTKNGNLRLVFSKCLVMLITLSSAFVLIYLPFFINFSNTFGTDSLNSPIIFMQDYSGINSTMTIMQNIIITGLIHYLVSLTLAMLGIMLSQLLKNNILTMIVASVIGLFPCIMCVNLDSVRFFTAFQNGMWQWLMPIIIASAIIICAVCFAFTVISFSKVRLRK
ncbi:MAG: hypothetical protein ACI4RM_06445 [Ruminococcus sp.]